MKEYHKIQTVFKRDPANLKLVLSGEFASPEFEFLQNNPWTFTEKVDGTNIRVIRKNGVVTFGGKTERASIPAKLVTRLQERFHGDPAIFDGFKGADFCLYGEGYGAGIQSGGVYRPDQDFVLFDVRVGEWWLQREAVEDVAEKLGVDVVPVVGTGTLHDMESMVRDGFPSMWDGAPVEGIVARPVVEMFTRKGERVITKLKRRDYP